MPDTPDYTKPYVDCRGRRFPSPAERFWAKVDKTSCSNGCWLWTASKNTCGYGCMRLNGRGGRMIRAHRFAYELLVGPIPEGLTIDHLCRVRHCVNPDHLEPVTMRENTLRGESNGARAIRTGYCKHGHKFTENNTIVIEGGRACRKCHYDKAKKYHQLRKAKGLNNCTCLSCGEYRYHKARGLCRRCHLIHRDSKTLDQFPKRNLRGSYS